MQAVSRISTIPDPDSPEAVNPAVRDWHFGSGFAPVRHAKFHLIRDFSSTFEYNLQSCEVPRRTSFKCGTQMAIPGSTCCLNT